MCFLEFEDRSGSLEALVFPTVYQESAKVLQSGEPFVIEGSVSQKEDETSKVLVNRIYGLGELSVEDAEKCLYLKLNSASDRRIPETLRLLRESPGTAEVKLYFAGDGKYHYPPGRLRVQANGKLLDELQELLGAENVALK